MDDAQAKRIIEALVFVFGQSIPEKRITEVLPEVSAADVARLVGALNDEYAAANRAFHIQEVAGGYQLVTAKDLAPWVKRALERPKLDAVSAAAMETLAIIAYRQPIAKADIEAVRGVDVTASLETLVERQFVRVTGRKETPGRPFLYATTPEFLRHFGLRSLEALPSMPTPTVQEPTGAEGPPAPASTAPARGPAAVSPEPAGASGEPHAGTD